MILKAIKRKLTAAGERQAAKLKREIENAKAEGHDVSHIEDEYDAFAVNYLIRAEDLAVQVKAWRGELTVRRAAALLGIPKRTWDNMEQGRGFPYPRLLQIAIQATDPNEGKQNG